MVIPEGACTKAYQRYLQSPTDIQPFYLMLKVEQQKQAIAFVVVVGVNEK
jgi:hypothetical protein